MVPQKTKARVLRAIEKGFEAFYWLLKRALLLGFPAPVQWLKKHCLVRTDLITQSCFLRTVVGLLLMPVV